jgi:hypothetical protein
MSADWLNVRHSLTMEQNFDYHRDNVDVQALDKIMETLQILYTFLYEYGVGPPSAFDTAAFLLGMDSYKF